nr:hypothetical protein [Ureaplasma parvum]
MKQTFSIEENLLKKIIEELLINKQCNSIQNKKNIQSYQKQTQVTNKLTTSNPKVILTKIDKHFNHLVVIMLMNRVFFNRLDAQVRNRLTKEQSLVINIIEDFYLYPF